MIEQCIEIAKNYPSDLTVGNASFNKIEFKGGRMDGYLEQRYLSEHFDVARLARNGNTWMSITPMELESHITHVLEATGDVLVGGLGMGYYITQIVSKPDVKSVVVIEKDMEVKKYTLVYLILILIGLEASPCQCLTTGLKTAQD